MAAWQQGRDFNMAFITQSATLQDQARTRRGGLPRLCCCWCPPDLAGPGRGGQHRRRCACKPLSLFGRMGDCARASRCTPCLPRRWPKALASCATPLPQRWQRRVLGCMGACNNARVTAACLPKKLSLRPTRIAPPPQPLSMRRRCLRPQPRATTPRCGPAPSRQRPSPSSSPPASTCACLMVSVWGWPCMCMWWWYRWWPRASARCSRAGGHVSLLPLHPPLLHGPAQAPRRSPSSRAAPTAASCGTAQTPTTGTLTA